MSKVIAAYGGGFKPPTAGHFEVVKKTLENNPEIDEFIIYVGSGERDGISQDEAILVWDMFANYLPMKVQILPSTAPIGDIIRLGKNNPEDEVYFVIGGRDDNEGDMKDISSRTKNIEAAYPNMKVKVIMTPDKGMSGTNARKAAKKSEEELIKFLPNDLTPEEKSEVFNIIRPVVKEMISEEIPNDVINSFDIQDTLVKDVWVDGELQPEIREKLLKIAQDFFDSLELPEGTILKDIKLTGSFANFNWSKFSDVDLHLVLDFSEISDNEEFAKDYFMAKKNLWNNAHDINIFGYPVEVYVEDKDEPHTASGLYSILNDEWITIPQQQKIIIDKDDIKSKAEGYLSILPQLKKMFKDGKYEEVIDTIEKTKTRIRDMRSSGLEKGGLYSVENLAFKVLRRSGYVEDLNKLLTQSYDNIMTLPESLNENATYTKKINLIDRLATLTQHMVDKGMNIEPLPKLEFKDGDSENASEFLGKTAYYDPNTQTIVLYTEGRHPKDITRSYAHEMIHHIQNLEGRLGDIRTTNTQEDDHLNDIEAEANLKGTMTFRNWTDSLNEGVVGNKIECDGCDWSWDIKDGGDDLYICHKCGHDNETLNEDEDPCWDDYKIGSPKTKKSPKTGKRVNNCVPKNESQDYFGLTKMVKETLISEEDVVSSPPMKYKIFSDMDGVLTDFEGRFKKYSDDVMPSAYKKRYGDDQFWGLIDGEGVAYWVGMPWMSDGKKYWDYIKDFNTELLSSPSRSETSRLGKRLWVKNNMPGVKLHLANSYNKKNYAEPNHILIDDRPSNIEQWIAAGGIGILHRTADETISQLKKLGL